VRSDDSDIDALLGDTIAKVGESPSVLEASARLQAMIDASRGQPKPLRDPKTLPVRFSRLKAFALSAAHYLQSCQDDFEETLAIRMGAGFHGAMFWKRPVLCYDGRRAGKAWERFERHGRELDAVILNEREYAVAMGMIDAVKRHDRAMSLLFDATTTEDLIEWNLGDRRCRSTPDAYTLKRVVELKSARSTEPGWFMREALRRHYHAQVEFYGQAITYAAGGIVEPSEYFIVAVENAPPFNVTVLRIPNETREVAAKLNHLWFAALLNAEANDYYGGYVDGDVELELPHYDHAPIDLELNGKLITVD
jgi:hypothetical protein